jgi:hypothetical protein
MLLGHLQDGLDKNGIALMSLFEGGQRGLGRAIRAFQQPQMDPGFGVGGVFGEQSVDGGARFVLLAKFAQNADGLDARPPAPRAAWMAALNPEGSGEGAELGGARSMAAALLGERRLA